jgi:hypothetical protein
VKEEIMRWIETLGAVALIAWSLVPSEVRAADRIFCEEYAAAAVGQSTTAAEAPRCRGEARGSRWSTDYRQHFEWCLGAQFEDARTEREKRHEYLERCHFRR